MCYYSPVFDVLLPPAQIIPTRVRTIQLGLIVLERLSVQK